MNSLKKGLLCGASGLSLALLVVFSAPIVAEAQVACGQRGAVIAKLSEKYGEVRRGGGLSSATEIFEIWASEATGSWTILKTTPNGLSCIMAVGDEWQDDKYTPPPIRGRAS